MRTLKIMRTKLKSEQEVRKYDHVIKFLGERMEYFNTDHLKLIVEAKQIDPVNDARQWARVLRSAASRGLCCKTDIYQKSQYRNTNNIPRCQWKKSEEGGKNE